MAPIGLMARKVGMTRIFESDGTVHPITVLEVGPCTVLSVKTTDGKDGYDALQLGFEPCKEKALNKPELGLFKKLGVTPFRHVQEVRVSAEVAGQFEAGQEVTFAEYNPGEFIDVVANSKGRGYAGVVKRHGHKGSKEHGHGTHEYFRHGGSLGPGSWPGRVQKNRKMAGRMGNTRFTIQNLRIIDKVEPKNLLLVRGAIPGPNGGLVMVRKAVKVYGKDAAQA